MPNKVDFPNTKAELVSPFKVPKVECAPSIRNATQQATLSIAHSSAVRDVDEQALEMATFIEPLSPESDYPEIPRTPGRDFEEEIMASPNLNPPEQDADSDAECIVLEEINDHEQKIETAGVPKISLATIIATVNQVTKPEHESKVASCASTKIEQVSPKFDHDIQVMDVDIRPALDVDMRSSSSPSKSKPQSGDIGLPGPSGLQGSWRPLRASKPFTPRFQKPYDYPHFQAPVLLSNVSMNNLISALPPPIPLCPWHPPPDHQKKRRVVHSTGIGTRHPANTRFTYSNIPICRRLP